MIKLKHLPLDQIKITSGFGHRNIMVNGKMKNSFHSGVDLGAKKAGVQGDLIYAVADYKVVVSKNDVNGYGFYIVLEHENDGQPFCSIYGHQIKLEVKVGRIGKAGDIIGRMGNSGSSTGVHLHCTLIEGSFTSTFFNKGVDGKQLNSVDPEIYFEALLKAKEVKPLTFDVIIMLIADMPDPWLRAVKTIVAIVKAEGELGDLEIAQYIPLLIEKAFNALEKVPGLSCDQILDKISNNPVAWKRAVKTVVAVAETDGHLGDLEIMAYLPDLIIKAYYSS